MEKMKKDLLEAVDQKLQNARLFQSPLYPPFHYGARMMPPLHPPMPPAQVVQKITPVPHYSFS